MCKSFVSLKCKICAALAKAQPTSPRSTGFCAIWDCISSSSVFAVGAHTAHRGWARLLLDRARNLIIHGPAHRGANGAAMPTDEGDQDGHFFFNHPERGATPLPRRAQPQSLLFRSDPPQRGA